MQKARKPLRKGMARVEYLALKPEIDDLLRRGYNIKMAYEALKDKGQVTMSYAAMYENVTRVGRKAQPAPTPQERKDI